MFVKVNCQFCQQPFDFDHSSGLPQADCPHCGKQNHVELPAPSPKPELTVQRDAPNLSGGRPCPSCKAQIARDATLCVHCGYNLMTGKPADKRSWFAAHRFLVLANLAGLVFAAFILVHVFSPKTESPAPAPVAAAEPAAETAAAPIAAPVPPPAPVVAPAEPAAPAAPDLPVTPPPPTADELAAQQAAADRDAFAAKKAQAERNLRLQLATREPPYQMNETVELRRKNGILDKGVFMGYSGTGTGRVALVAAPTGQIGVPLAVLDNASRRRIDPDYREAFIQHLLSTKLPDDAGETPAATPAPVP